MLKIQDIGCASVNCWNNFWFKPISTRPLGIFRIFYGILVMQWALLLIPDLFVWFGKDGILSNTAVNSWQPHVRLNVLNLFPDNDTWLLIVFVTLFIAAICLTAGFLTRISTIMVFLCLLSLHSRNYLIINSGDVFMRMLAFWLIFSPAGNSFSIDHWLKIKRFKEFEISHEQKMEAAPWAQRLMQINMSLIYAHTFTSKLMGADWLNGTAVYFSSHFTEMQHLPISYVFDHLWSIKVVTWATLAIEFSLILLIWFKPIRYYVMALGVLMHLAIDWSMLIPQFEWVMIVSYILFIEPKDLDALLVWIRLLFKKSIKKFQFA